MNNARQNKVGRLIENYTMRNIKCVDCETRLRSVNYSWVDLLCSNCGSTYEVKATMKNEPSSLISKITRHTGSNVLWVMKNHQRCVQ